jgi:hypothetical protein
MTIQKYFPCWRASMTVLPVKAVWKALAEQPTLPYTISSVSALMEEIERPTRCFLRKCWCAFRELYGKGRESDAYDYPRDFTNLEELLDGHSAI